MKIFKKITALATTALMLGSSVGIAAAANYPTPFVSGGVANVAIVYGTGQGVSSLDMIQASNIQSDLQTYLKGDGVVTVEGGETEDEIVLGATINATGKLSGTALTDSKISSLLDDKVTWDDGTGSDDYDVHEEIILGTMAVKTTLDDNDFEGVALINDKALEYRYVFDESFNRTGVGATGADDLYLTILGKTYQVSSMTSSSFTVYTSDEISLAIGESTTVDGKTFTVDDIFSGKAQVNGEIISEGSTETINGLKVKVDSVGYHSNSPELSKVILRIGEDISKSYASGEEYVGEDKTDPQWVWTYSDPNTALGYIGVKYNYDETDDEDDVVYEGESYTFPEDFAEVKLDKLTNVDYSDFKVYFDESEDLWNSTDKTSTAQSNNKKVVVIQAVNGDKDAIKMTSGKETNKMYLYWASNTTGTETNAANGGLEVFYSDVNGDVSDSIKPRLDNYTLSSNAAAGAIAATDLGDLIVGDTTVRIEAKVVAGDLTLNFTDGGYGHPIVLDMGGVLLNQSQGELSWLGGNTETTSKKTGETGDIVIGGNNSGTDDNDVMTYNGLIVREPENNADNDEVIISVPSDRVYAQVSVIGKGGSSSSTGGSIGDILVTDAEVSSVSSKNLIIVGGSCINSAAANLLGGAYCGEAFTSATGVGTGQFLIKGFGDSTLTSKHALLVAGYDQADTQNAATYLKTQKPDTAKEYIGTSSTSAELVVSE